MEALRVFLEDAGYVLGLALAAVALAALGHGLVALLTRPWRRARSGAVAKPGGARAATSAAPAAPAGPAAGSPAGPTAPT